MPDNELPGKLEVEERWGLRFWILCEYYVLEHRGESPYQVTVYENGPQDKRSIHENPTIHNLRYRQSSIVKSEIRAAEKYLVESGLLKSRIMRKYSTGAITSVGGISNKGIDLVERAAVESESRELNEAVSEKSIEKVERFVKKCFKHQATESALKVINTIVTLLQAS